MGKENRSEKVSHVQYSFSFSLLLVLAQDAQDLSENYSARLRRGGKEGKGRSLLAPCSVVGTPQIRHRCVSSPPQPDPPPFFLEGTGGRAASPRPPSSHPLEPPLLWGDGRRGRGLEGRRKIEYRFLFSKHLCTLSLRTLEISTLLAHFSQHRYFLPPHALGFVYVVPAGFKGAEKHSTCLFFLSAWAYKFRDAREGKKFVEGISFLALRHLLFFSPPPPLLSFLG